MTNILLNIILVLLILSFLVSIVKSLGNSEGYKTKELELEKEELRLKIIEADNRNMQLERALLNERTQKSNIMLEVFNSTLYDGNKTPEEKVKEMLYNDSVLYKREEI